MIGTLACIVIDCPDPQHLAPFYEALLGLRRVHDDPDWVTLGDRAAPPRIALQQVTDHRRPGWSPGEAPQQMHLDVLVADLDVAEVAVLALGATLLEGSDKPIGYRVYADPVGHPFCLVTREGLT